jgi:hypothetical protein
MQQLELLVRVVETGREPGRMQQPPEVVARIGEVRLRGRGNVAGIDAAKDDPEPWREDVGDVARSGRR